MQSKGWILTSPRTVVAVFFFLFGLLLSGAAWAQDGEDGNADLDKAFDAKLNATSTKDLDAVVKLCESAIEKGLDKEGQETAKTLAGSALFEHAEQLGQRIFASSGQDTRWRIYRSQALSRLRKVNEFQPDMAEAYLMIAKLNGLPGGDQDEALEAIEKAVELAGDDNEQLSDALFLRAKLTDDEETRIADLNQAIKINPENIDALWRRANYYLSKRNPTEALPDLKKWLDADPKNVQKHLLVATSLMRTGSQFDKTIQGEAIDILDTAIELEPDNTRTHTLRAQLNLIAGNPEEAIEDASRAIKLDRKNTDAMMIRATVLSELAGSPERDEEQAKKDLVSALEDVEEVLDVVPYHVEGIRRRGIIYTQQRELAKAIQDFKLLAENDRSNQFYQRQLAMLYNADDQPSRAIRIYKNLIQQNSVKGIEGKPVDLQIVILARRMAALRGAGDAQLSTGDHAKAVENYTEALEMADQIFDIEEAEGREELTSPEDSVLNNLAWVLSTSPDDKVRDGKRAIELATQAAEQSEYKEAYILSTLASAYAEVGDFENAIKWIEKAIEVNQENGENGSVGKERTKEQRASLQKEYEKYQEKKPWRELKDAEAEKAAKKKALAKEKEAKEKEESKKKEKAEDKEDKDKEDKDEVSVEEGFVPLFDGKTLNGWTAAKGDSEGPSPFSVNEKERAIHCYGGCKAGSKQVSDCLNTDQEFSHFILKMEYKWLEKRFAPRTDWDRDAGLPFHVHGDLTKVWPLSLEMQIGESPADKPHGKDSKGRYHTGDLFVLGKDLRTDTPIENKLYSAGGKRKTGRSIKTHLGVEKPKGQWNEMEIQIHGSEKATFILNGEVVLETFNFTQKNKKGKKVPLSKGRIGLQSEWAEILYRNIRIKELPVDGSSK